MEKRTIKITEKALRKIIREAVRKYALIDTDELMEFMMLTPDVTGLNVDIFVDDGGSYKRNNRKLILFARNGYGRGCSEFIPFAISNDANIMDTTIDYKISYNEIFDIQDFIVFNLKSLILLADQKIEQEVFYDNIISIQKQERFVAESVIISEMASLSAEKTKLPVDIWLDEGGTYQGHAPRIKFRASREQRTTREYSSMIISDNPTIENFPKNSPIKKKDIEKLKNFVIINKNLLLDLANNKINYRNDFLPNVKF